MSFRISFPIFFLLASLCSSLSALADSDEIFLIRERASEEIHQTEEVARPFALESEQEQPQEILARGESARIEQIEPPEGDPILHEKLIIDYYADDTTAYGEARKKAHKVSVGYRLADNAVLGLEAQKELVDSGDESARGKSVETDDALNVKYKLEF